MSEKFKETTGYTQPFQKIAQASKTTGLSQHLLRQMVKDGTAPHIMSGSTYYINIPKLLRKLNALDEQ